MPVIRRRHALAFGSCGFLFPSSLRAQGSWPSGPVTVIVGYAVGGSTDIVARTFAQVMSPLIGQQVIVDNRAGATGSVGIRAAAAAKPDGQTLLYGGVEMVINPHIQKGMIDTIATLAPICQTATFQYVLVVSPKVLANSAAELVALARKDPEKLTYASAGIASNSHLAGALFAKATGIKITHVPYKGTGPALADVVSGQITMMISSLPPAVGQTRAGNVKALAVTGDKKVESLPNVPTLKEQGIDVDVAGMHGVFAPVRTPPGVLDKIEQQAKAAMNDSKWNGALANYGLEPPPERTRAEYARFVAGEHNFWGQKLKELNIAME